MFRGISRCATTVIIFALFSCSSSIPVNSGNVKCVTEKLFPLKSAAADIGRQDAAIGAFRRSKDLHGGGVNLDEGALATLAKLANLRVANLAAIQQQKQRSVAMIAKNTTEMKSGMSTQNYHDVSDTQTLEKSELKPRTFHCHPIEDIFIPAVDKKVPAYICKLDRREFIISSERFLQDSKYHLDITIDESTFQRLVVPDETVKENLVGNVIPVTLTQRQGDEFYGIKTTQF